MPGTTPVQRAMDLDADPPPPGAGEQLAFRVGTRCYLSAAEAFREQLSVVKPNGSIWKVFPRGVTVLHGKTEHALDPTAPLPSRDLDLLKPETGNEFGSPNIFIFHDNNCIINFQVEFLRSQPLIENKLAWRCLSKEKSPCKDKQDLKNNVTKRNKNFKMFPGLRRLLCPHIHKGKYLNTLL